MKTIKRVLSLFLSVAMVVTGVNLGMLSKVQAAEQQPVILQAERFEGAGAQADASKVGIGTTNSGNSDNRKNGNNNGAAFRQGETAYQAQGGIGSARTGAIQFDVSQFTSSEEIDEAILTIQVTGTMGNLSSSVWTKAAIFQTDNPASWTVKTATDAKDVPEADRLGPDFPAKGGDYSYDATMWSKENIYQKNQTQTITFDVARALKAAIDTGGKHMVLRLQTVAEGFNVAGKRTASDATAPADVPTLTVTTSKKSVVAVEYLDEAQNKLRENKIINLV